MLWWKYDKRMTAMEAQLKAKATTRSEGLDLHQKLLVDDLAHIPKFFKACPERVVASRASPGLVEISAED